MVAISFLLHRDGFLLFCCQQSDLQASAAGVLTHHSPRVDHVVSACNGRKAAPAKKGMLLSNINEGSLPGNASIVVARAPSR
jgi:hypothetical protein